MSRRGAGRRKEEGKRKGSRGSREKNEEHGSRKMEGRKRAGEKRE